MIGLLHFFNRFKEAGGFYRLLSHTVAQSLPPFLLPEPRCIELVEMSKGKKVLPVNAKKNRLNMQPTQRTVNPYENIISLRSLREKNQQGFLLLTKKS